MRALVVYCHPVPESFCASIRDAAVEVLTRRGWEVRLLDLYAETPDPKRPVVCFDERPTQLIGEVRQPVPAEPASSNATIANTAATARPICSSSSMPTGPGARSRSPTGAPTRTLPPACASWSKSIIPRRR